MKIMNKIKVFIGAIVLIATLFSCEAYEDYTYDYDYTSVYFGSQTPIRTIVADGDMSFEFGVTMGGVRSNDNDEWATYTIDETLLDTYDTDGSYTLMPEEYYTLSNDSIFLIAEGEYAGTVTCTLDQDLFTADVLSTDEIYAIPLQIKESSLDTILSEKDYSIILVKYVSPYSGTYYSKGVQYTLDVDGNSTDTITFYDADLSQNDTKVFTTLGVNYITTTSFGDNISGDMELTINDDNSVTVSSEDVTIDSDDNCTYDEDESIFYLNIQLTKSGTSYSVSDTLVLRQYIEDDLRYDEW